MNDLDNVASEYFPNAATSVENDLILNWYPKRVVNRFGHCGRLLELGLGHGYAAELFHAACDSHVIVEGSRVVIDQFRKQNPGSSIEIVEGFFETFQPDAPFDVIIMGFVLEHVDDPGLLLRRYKSYLAPGGRMFIAVPNAKSLNRRLGLELGLIDDIYSLNKNDLALGHKRQFCRDTLGSLVEQSGYRIVHVEGIYLKPLPLGVLQTLPDFEANLQAMLRVGVDFPDLCVGLLMEISPA